MTNEEVDRLLDRAVQEAAPNELYKYAFARLVAAYEREACAKICEDSPHPDGSDCAYLIRSRT